VGIEPREEASKEAESFLHAILNEKADFAVFMTGPGVYSLVTAARELGIEKSLIDALNRMTIVARSPKPKVALVTHGVRVDIVPEENTAEGVAKVLKTIPLTDKKIVVLWHGSYSNLLRSELESAGARVYEYSTYSYSLQLGEKGSKLLEEMGYDYVPPDVRKVFRLIEDMSKGVIDVITFTSPPSARNLFKIAEDNRLRESLLRSLSKGIIVVAVGPPTRKALEENGVTVNVTPSLYKMGSMVKALADYLDERGVPKRCIAPPNEKIGAE
jgi:uroporphyrinogen-III synthase